MPQAPLHLQTLFNDDGDAWRQLAANFTDRAGVISPRPGYLPTAADYLAVDYLILEWDYGYAPEGNYE